MGREEARAKGWNTFRENMIGYAKEHPEYNLDDFIFQRTSGAYKFWRESRAAERSREFEKVRGLYVKAVESLAQVAELTRYPAAVDYAEKLKAEYHDFVVHRDPYYRLNLKVLLPLIQEEPGILQTETYKRLHLPRPDITYTLYFAEQEGLIRREEKGRSYLLFFERDKAADEPLLNIQDDEIDIQKKTEDAESTKRGCLFVFSFIFWVGAFGAAGGYIGPDAAAIVVVAFIAWQIIKRIRRRKEAKKAGAGLPNIIA